MSQHCKISIEQGMLHSVIKVENGEISIVIRIGHMA